MTRERIKAVLKRFWANIDTLVYLLGAGLVGAVLAYGAANRQFQNEREELTAERASLVARIVSVRKEEQDRCIAVTDGIREDYRTRAEEWKQRLGDLTIQVENANRNADSCHAQVAQVAKQANKAASNSAVAAKKSTEAADAATAEHAQSTLLRKYGKDK